MNNTLIANILKLNLTGLPSQFTSLQLENCAKSQIDDLRVLLNIDSLLHHTKLDYNYEIQTDSHGLPCLNIVLGLTLKSQSVLNYSFQTITLGALELQVMDDRQRLIHACKNLPLQSSAVVNAVADRINAACLDLPVEELRPEIASRLDALLRVKKQHWNGTVSDSLLQHELPSLPRFEWHREVHEVRVLLYREKSGYSLKFLKSPTFQQPAARLPMPQRPKDLATTEALERAEFRQDPVNIAIRVGSRLGSDAIVVADFQRFLT